MVDSVSLAAMPTASINDLPDSAFAYIEPGGKKDAQGKTVPRSLRHFPVHDAAHARNALARAPQSPFGDKAMAKIRAACKKFGIKISADENIENTPHFGYIVDLENYVFDEDDAHKSWIQAFPLGKWQHPTYGEIEMTLDKAVSMAANVNAGVRGQDLDIDYDHKEHRADAAGWVEKAEARTDGLWLLIDWTREAAEKIKSKAYRYFSPEFSDKWEHSASGKVFKNVLFGGALTNRPHLKGILPINLSEYETNEATNNTERELLESLAKIYGVPFEESDSDAQLKDAIAAIIANMKKQRAKKKSKKKSYEEQIPSTVHALVDPDIVNAPWSAYMDRINSMKEETYG